MHFEKEDFEENIENVTKVTPEEKGVYEDIFSAYSSSSLVFVETYFYISLYFYGVL